MNPPVPTRVEMTSKKDKNGVRKRDDHKARGSGVFPQKQGKVGRNNPPERTRFKPGQSGNPGGLPKGTPKVSIALMRLLATEATSTFEPKTRAEQIAKALFDKAVGGDVGAIRELSDRTEGKSPATVTMNKGDARAEHYRRIAMEMADRYGKPLDEVVRDLVELEPEAAPCFEGWVM